MLLTGLSPGNGYYFSIISSASGSQYVSSNFFFTTTNYTTANLIFDVSQYLDLHRHQPRRRQLDRTWL